MLTDFALTDSRRVRRVHVEYVGGSMKYKAYAHLPYFEYHEFGDSASNAVEKLIKAASYCGWAETDILKRKMRNPC